ncbi:MAG: hypothetical protein J6Q61_01585 [Bacteroidales bacterium]|nr:hypothetical protein [Bacteroidales bacterium]
METRITQKIIEWFANFNKDEYGVYDEELTRLELEDAERKGCLVDHGPYCMNCQHNRNNTCPLNDWQKRHPEFVNDELDRKIKARLDELHKVVK